MCKKLNPEEVERLHEDIKRLHTLGYSDRKMVILLHKQHRTIKHHRELLGLSPNAITDNNAIKLTKELLFELHAKGMTDSEIAKAAGVSIPTVSEVRRRHNLVINRSKYNGVNNVLSTNLIRQQEQIKLARSYGLPDDTQPSELLVIFALLSGPLTYKQIAVKLGLKQVVDTYINRVVPGLVKKGLLTRRDYTPDKSGNGTCSKFMLSYTTLTMLQNIPQDPSMRQNGNPTSTSSESSAQS